MPELPDVQIFKEFFDDNALNEKVTRIEVKDDQVLETTRKNLKEIEGETFLSSKRVGKYLFSGAGKKFLIMHFGMTGNLDLVKSDQTFPKHTRPAFVSPGLSTSIALVRHLCLQKITKPWN